MVNAVPLVDRKYIPVFWLLSPYGKLICNQMLSCTKKRFCHNILTSLMWSIGNARPRYPKNSRCFYYFRSITFWGTLCWHVQFLRSSASLWKFHVESWKKCSCQENLEGIKIPSSHPDQDHLYIKIKVVLITCYSEMWKMCLCKVGVILIYTQWSLRCRSTVGYFSSEGLNILRHDGNFYNVWQTMVLALEETPCLHPEIAPLDSQVNLEAEHDTTTRKRELQKASRKRKTKNHSSTEWHRKELYTRVWQ